MTAPHNHHLLRRLQDMIRVFLTLSFVLFVSSSGVQYELVCYGEKVSLPYLSTTPVYNGSLYFTPSNSGPRHLLMDEGKALDPRIKVYSGKVYLTDLTENDDGTFAATFGDRVQDVLRLKMWDCTKKISKFYGDSLGYDVPKQAEFLQFEPIHSVDQPTILWNRSDPQVNVGKRGEVKKNVFKILRSTQADNGYYSFKKKDNTLMSRLHLTVKENHKNADEKVEKSIFINYPWTGGPWTVTFKPEHREERETVIKEGVEIWDDNSRFFRRIYARKNHIEISYLEYGDAGIFEFRDREGHLALTVHLNIIRETFEYSALIHIAIGLAGLVVFACCSFYFVKRCCLKDRFVTQTAAAPTTYSHDVNPTRDPRPSNTQYSSAFPRQTVNSAVSKGPTRADFDPLVSPPVDQGSVPAPSSNSNFLSSDTEPRFELKGLSFPSATLLSSDTPSSDVYTSDKLNFL